MNSLKNVHESYNSVGIGDGSLANDYISISFNQDENLANGEVITPCTRAHSAPEVQNDEKISEIAQQIRAAVARAHKETETNLFINEVDNSKTPSMQQIYIQGKKTLGETKQVLETVYLESGGPVLIDICGRYFVQHKVLAILLATTAFTLALSFLFFMVFTLGAMILTFIGFAFVEGSSSFSLVSIFIFGFFGSVVVLILFFGGIILIGYMGFKYIYDLFGAFHYKKALTDFISKEKLKFKERNKLKPILITKTE